MSVYLPVCLPVYLPDCLLVCLPACLPASPSVCMSVCLSVGPSICLLFLLLLSLSLSVCLSLFLYFCINETQNEYHFLFQWPIYMRTSKQNLHQTVPLDPRKQQLKQEISPCRNVSKFIFHATNKRKQFLDSKSSNK